MNVSVYLTEEESKVLKDLCKKQELCPGNLLRQALRLYQAVNEGNMIVSPVTELRKFLVPSDN